MHYLEREAVLARARADAVTESRARAQAIIDPPEGKRAPTAARYFAYSTDIGAADVCAALALLPAEDATARAAEVSKAGWGRASARANAWRSGGF